MTFRDMATTHYHRDLGIPDSLPRPRNFLPLVYSKHALFQARNRHLDIDRLPHKLCPGFQVVEVTTLMGLPQKYLVRVPWNSQNDLVLSVETNGRVRTVWTNATTDQHATLDMLRYTHV